MSGYFDLICRNCGASASFPLGMTCADHQPRVRLHDGYRWCPGCGGNGEVWVMDTSPDQNETRHDCTFPGCVDGAGIVPVAAGSLPTETAPAKASE